MREKYIFLFLIVSLLGFGTFCTKAHKEKKETAQFESGQQKGSGEGAQRRRRRGQQPQAAEEEHRTWGPDDVVDLLAIHLIGIVPEDKAVIISTNNGVPITLDSKSLAGQAYHNIARRLLGENVPLLDLDKGSGFLSRISSVFGSGD